MLFLDPAEAVRLQNILIKHPLIVHERTRVAVLKQCSIYTLLTSLDISGGASIFATSLLAEVQEPHLLNDYGQPPLVALLAYLRSSHENRWAQEELAFLELVALRCQQWSDECNPDKKAMREAFMLQQDQSAASALTSLNLPAKLDFRRELATAYDLKPVMSQFTDPLMPGQAFGFVLAGEVYTLREYIIVRMLQEFQDTLKGEYFSFAIDLSQQDLLNTSLDTLLEEKLKHTFNYAYAREVVTKRAQEHVILTIWNTDLPLLALQTAISSFWQRFIPAIERHLQKKHLCFVLILAHLPPEAQSCTIEDFTFLQLPTFNVQQSVRPWVTRTLLHLHVPPAERKVCLNLLNDEHTNPFQIFRCLESMASFLQGEFDKGRFDAARSRSAKRKSLLR